MKTLTIEVLLLIIAVAAFCFGWFGTKRINAAHSPHANSYVNAQNKLANLMWTSLPILFVILYCVSYRRSILNNLPEPIRWSLISSALVIVVLALAFLIAAIFAAEPKKGGIQKKC